MPRRSLQGLTVKRLTYLAPSGTDLPKASLCAERFYTQGTWNNAFSRPRKLGVMGACNIKEPEVNDGEFEAVEATPTHLRNRPQATTEGMLGMDTSSAQDQ